MHQTKNINVKLDCELMNIICLRINMKTLTVSLCHEIIRDLKKVFFVEVNYAFIKYTSVLFKINK